MKNFGRFSGDLKARYDESGDTIELLEDLIFFDASSRAWIAEKGTISDGASIPRPLWSIIGSPLKGRYVRPAVIHDKYCDIRIEPWEKVHLMFHNALRAAGVGAKMAKTMYWAVMRFGPRWGHQQIRNVRHAIGSGVRDDLARRQAAIMEMQSIVNFVASRNPSLEHIHRLLEKSDTRPLIADGPVRPGIAFGARQRNAAASRTDLSPSNRHYRSGAGTIAMAMPSRSRAYRSRVPQVRAVREFRELGIR